MEIKYFDHIGIIESKSIYSYRTLLLILTKSTYMQVQSANIFKIPKQNITRHVNELEIYGLIEVARIKEKDKFFRAVTNMSRLNTLILEQIKMA